MRDMTLPNCERQRNFSIEMVFGYFGLDTGVCVCLKFLVGFEMRKLILDIEY